MILSQVRNYLRHHGRASVRDMAARFDMEAGAIEGMMEILTQRGQVKRLDCTSCASTGSCSMAAGTAIYMWKEGKGP
jgi:hypothetical protein